MGVDACDGEDGFVGEVLVVIDDGFGEQGPVEEAPFGGVASGVEVAEVGDGSLSELTEQDCGTISEKEQLDPVMLHRPFGRWRVSI